MFYVMCTALHYASYKGYKDCVMTLLSVPEIDVEIKNSAKKTASQLSTKKEIESLFKLFKTPGMKSVLGMYVWMDESTFLMHTYTQNKQNLFGAKMEPPLLPLLAMHTFVVTLLVVTIQFSTIIIIAMILATPIIPVTIRSAMTTIISIIWMQKN